MQRAKTSTRPSLEEGGQVQKDPQTLRSGFIQPIQTSAVIRFSIQAVCVGGRQIKTHLSLICV